MQSVALSIIVPLYNCLELTQAMLASLEATLPPTVSREVLLIDDGSTDGTRGWLESLPATRCRVLLNERNLGFAATNNRAAAAARGERLLLLNNDVVLPPGWFEPLLAAHRRLGTRAGVIGNIQLNARTREVDHAGIQFSLKAKPEHDRVPPNGWERILRPVRLVPAVTAACAMIDAKLWRDLGGFDEGYVNGGEDVDLCFRARVAGRTNAVALRSVILHHISSSTGRKTRDEANSQRLAARWRPHFVACGARRWSRTQAETIVADPRRYEPRFAWRVWRHARGWTSTPPPEAVATLNAALDLEFVRWHAIQANA